MKNVMDDMSLDDVEARIRTREAEKNPADDTILAAPVHARVTSGRGLHLENACPYVRNRSEEEDCDTMPVSACVGKENYRNCQSYILRIVHEDLDILR